MSRSVEFLRDEASALNEALYVACSNGELDEVRNLLADPRVIHLSSAFFTACRYGHLAVAKLLLPDQRTDPTVNSNFAFRYASENGHVEVVKLLLVDPRVDPSSDDNAAFNSASRNGHVGIVKLLLGEARVNPMSNNYTAFERACKQGHVEVVRLLLADARAKPTLNVIKNALEEVGEQALAQRRAAVFEAMGDTYSTCTGVNAAHPTGAEPKTEMREKDRQEQQVLKEKRAAVIDFLLNSQPQLMQSLYRGEGKCGSDGPLRQELDRWETRSSFFLLLCVNRIQSTQTAARVSDVLREVVDVFARFETEEV